MTVTITNTDGTTDTYEGVVQAPWQWRGMLCIDQGGDSLRYVPLANVAEWAMPRQVVPS